VVGAAAYGLLYALVHDVYIHRRLPLFGRRHALLDRLAEAHRIHHLFHGEPYGMLLPVVPRVLRQRAGATARDPLTRTA
jgi:beta-carotene 3-hydroxylase